MLYTNAWHVWNLFSSTQTQTFCLDELSFRSCAFGVAIIYCVAYGKYEIPFVD
ncbi:hypothetical protein D3C85_561130 [compost metagenome]